MNGRTQHGAGTYPVSRPTVHAVIPQEHGWRVAHPLVTPPHTSAATIDILPLTQPSEPTLETLQAGLRTA
jgi:hypothetical protein